MDEMEMMQSMKHKSCFTCGHCCTDACPNIQYDACEQYWGYGIAEDCGLERVKCSKCYLNSGECEDCLFQHSEDCPEVENDKR